MKWIEIIRLRALDHLRQTAVIELLSQIVADVSTSDVTFTLYHHATIETDLSIHLVWNSNILEPGKSALGTKLAYLLREFGDVDYFVWIELWSL
ncbi:hypothetical protein U27_02931 [Candidatus Vecturithrix granuli]|uniref:Uncharacterized protein n=1 Tax=Vecturithrix granuli TaxID=1499967 RepID=A0A081BUG5_VECG1|nr:hypothetical protein U27_02931 [Candidatus Vecturithrix granuli]